MREKITTLLKTIFSGSFFRENVWYIGSSIFVAGFHFIYSVGVKSYIMPLEYGIFSTCCLMKTYLAYLQLGTLNAFNRDYPQLIGARDIEQSEIYSKTVFSFVIYMYLGATIIISLVMFVLKKVVGIDDFYCYGFMLISFSSFLTIIDDFGSYKCRIERGFKIPSIISVMELVALPIGMVCIKKYGFYALFLANLVASTIGIICYIKFSIYDRPVRISIIRLKRILYSGFPLLINGLVWTAINSIDKFVILFFISTHMLGIYGIAQNAFSYMILIPTAMSQLCYMRMGKKYGENKDINELNGLSLRYTKYLAILTCIIAVFALYFMPILVRKIMPAYVEGIMPAKILIVGLAIYASTLVTSNILTVLKANVLLLKSSLFMCICNIICSTVLVMIRGRQIENVALGTILSYTLYALLIIVYVNKCAGIDYKSLIKVGILPVALGMLVTVVVSHFLNGIVGFVVTASFVTLIFIAMYKYYQKDRNE